MFPICSAEQPAQILNSFADAWQNWRNSEEGKTMRKNSQKKSSGKGCRISIQIFDLIQKEQRAKWIARWINDNWNWHSWYKLTHEEQSLWMELTTGVISHQISELRMQQQLQKQQQQKSAKAADVSAAVAAQHALQVHSSGRNVAAAVPAQDALLDAVTSESDESYSTDEFSTAVTSRIHRDVVLHGSFPW